MKAKKSYSRTIWMKKKSFISPRHHYSNRNFATRQKWKRTEMAYFRDFQKSFDIIDQTISMKKESYCFFCAYAKIESSNIQKKMLSVFISVKSKIMYFFFASDTLFSTIQELSDQIANVDLCCKANEKIFKIQIANFCNKNCKISLGKEKINIGFQKKLVIVAEDGLTIYQHVVSVCKK